MKVYGLHALYMHSEIWNIRFQEILINELNYYYNFFITKLRWALFVTYTIIQCITSSEMCSLHLTHPSVHTPGAVGSRRCGARGAVGLVTWGCGFESRPRQELSMTEVRPLSKPLPQPQVTSLMLYPLEPRLPPYYTLSRFSIIVSAMDFSSIKLQVSFQPYTCYLILFCFWKINNF